VTREELRRRIWDVLDNWTSGAAAPTAAVMKFVAPVVGERDRYRLAWLSARRRAADEANYGLEALDCQREETRRWRRGHEAAEAKLTYAYREIEQLRAELEERKATDAPRLEYAGQDEDGEVWRLKEA
jgi:hypothetical protein